MFRARVFRQDAFQRDSPSGNSVERFVNDCNAAVTQLAPELISVPDELSSRH
jgi:hypothetical protein